MTNQLYQTIRQLAFWIATAVFLSSSPAFAIGDSAGSCVPLDRTLIRAAKYDSAEELVALLEYNLNERIERLNKTDIDDIRQQGIAEWRRLTKVQLLINSQRNACDSFGLLWYAVNYGNISVTNFLLSLGADPITWNRSLFESKVNRDHFPNYFSDCGRWGGRPKELKSELRAEYLARIRTTYGLLADKAEKSAGKSLLQEILWQASVEPSCQREDGFYKELMLELSDQSRRRESQH